LLNSLQAAEAPVASAEHLHLAVKRHEADLHPELRMTLADLLAEFRERCPVGLGFRLRGCDLRLAIGDLGGAAIAMVDRDDPLDVVQLNGGGEIVPKCLVPLLERRGDHADRRAGDDELAELAGQVLLDGISVHRLLHARIDAGQNHRLVVPFGRERETGREGERSAADSNDAQKLSAMEYGCITAAARAQTLMQFCHYPSLSTAARKSRVAEWYRSQERGPTRHAAVSQGVRLASAAGASSRRCLRALHRASRICRKYSSPRISSRPERHPRVVQYLS